MKDVFVAASKRVASRKAISTVEYGLTAALAAGAIISLAMLLQSEIPKQSTTKCYTLGTVLTQQ